MVIPKSVHKEHMQRISGLDIEHSNIVDHFDPVFV